MVITNLAKDVFRNPWFAFHIYNMSHNFHYLSSKVLLTGIAALVLCTVQATSAQSATVTLRWDANPEPDIAGYRLYYGTASHTYTQAIDVGNSTTATVSNLPAGVIYFALTAYNTTCWGGVWAGCSDFESPFSNEVAYGAPTPTPTPTQLTARVSLPIDTFDNSVAIATVIIKPVVTTNIDPSLNYVGFQGDFTFNETVVTFSTPFVEKAGLTAGNWNVLGNVLPGPGPIRTLRVLAFSNDFMPLSGSGTLFNLRMLRVSSTPGASTPLTWAADPDNFIFIDANLNTHVPDQNNGLITITGALPTPAPVPTPTPLITVSPTTVNFTAVAGGAFPAPQSIQVTTSNGASWNSFDPSPWFDAYPTSGPSGASTTLTPHTEGLVAGTYSQSITFSATGLPDKIVVVNLVVTASLTPTVRDDFNRADGGLGPNWTNSTWGEGLSISGNRVVATSQGVHYWNANTFAADQYSQIRLTGVVGSWSGVFVRGNLSLGPYYMVAVKPDGAYLYSSLSQLAHDGTGWATGDVLRLEVRTVAPSTARLTVYRNGTELFSYDDAERFIASGQPGIGLRVSTGGMSLDDWEGGEGVTSSPPPPNQVAAFSFSEGSGTTTIDNSGSGHNGTLVNGPTWTAGKYGNGLSFDGTNDYVSVANPAGVNLGTSDFTIAAWVKRQVTGVEDNILSKTASGAWVSGGKEFFISGSDNTLAFGSYGVGEVHSTGTITNDGLWHYVTVSFVDSSGTVRLYIDGVLSGTGTLNLPADDGSHAIRIGSNPAGSLMHGALDELRIFNRALSPSEIVSIMGTAIIGGE